MFNLLQKYITWLHTQWPAGVIEKLPLVKEDGSSNIPGLYIVGDLTGIPLLKFSSHSGARAVINIVADLEFQKMRSESGHIFDLAIIGAGVSGMAAALQAKKAGLSFEIFEASEAFSTIVNFPKGKPIYTYPTEMIPEGDLQFSKTVKEPLLEELKVQTLDKGIMPQIKKVEKISRRDKHFELSIPGDKPFIAQRVIIGIGRSGNFRKLGIPGEDRDKVYNRLHDPKDFCDLNTLVVGGGDSALETAIALAQCGAFVTLSYRKAEFSRPKLDNITNLQSLMVDPQAAVAVESPISERVTTSTGGYLIDPGKTGSINLMMKSQVQEITEKQAILIDHSDKEVRLENDAVFTMIGREPPLDFFRRNGLKILGEMGVKQWLSLALFVLFCTFVYNWKAGGALTKLFQDQSWFPFNIMDMWNALGQSFALMAANTQTFLGTLNITLQEPGFYYSSIYTLLVIIFGIKRIQRRKTPYIKVQTLSLTAVQIIPLFLLPYIVLPLLGNIGFFDSGIWKNIADALFPAVDYGHGREYWRAFGFILAWPLFIWNVFTSQPMGWWLAISLVQTFILIPLTIYFWGKGAYCGWICSCGAMAETLGDTHRQKMPHGAFWNRVNVVGQVILLITFVLLFSRIFSWLFPQSSIGIALDGFYQGLLYGWSVFGIQLNYKYIVDLFIAGIIGYGLYFWYSGRVWCRFACPLAALMHIYARFSRFRILAEKKKCISCNVCTSVCHQGIDIMNFANKGLPMEDPECVRCSACVQSCPTGVLEFGQINRKSGEIIIKDKLAASPVLLSEQKISKE